MVSSQYPGLRDDTGILSTVNGDRRVDNRKEEMMEKQGGITGKEQYVDTKYVREHLMVSRTKAYEIVKEIEEGYAPEAVVRIGRSLRVRKDVFCRWVEGQASRTRTPEPGSLPARRRKTKPYAWRVGVGSSFLRCRALP